MASRRGWCALLACLGVWIGPRPACGQVACPVVTLQPPEFAAFSRFGWAVAIDGDLAVVGRPELSKFRLGGAAYLYRRRGASWNLEEQLVAPDPQGSDWFGWKVAVHGDVALVSALHHTYPSPLSAGVAFVFRRDVDGWGKPQELYAWNPVITMFDAFADSLDVHGNTIIIGDRLDSEAGDSAGAAYIFRFNPGSGLWEQEQKLFAEDDESFKFDFGRAVTIVDDLAIVTAMGVSVGPVDFAGAAYAFRYHPERRRWVQEQKLVAKNFDGKHFDQFGWSAAMSRDGGGGHVAIIGARDDDPPGGFPQGNGSAYLFRRDPRTGLWSQEQELLPVLQVSAEFGFAVDIEGDWAVIGAPHYLNGLAQVYHHDGSRWNLMQSITPSVTGQSSLGWAVGLSGNMAILGAQGEQLFSGLAYIHNLNPIFADLNCDDQVNGLDVMILLASWGPTRNTDDAPSADLDGNGMVNGFDLALLLAAWG